MLPHGGRNWWLIYPIFFLNFQFSVSSIQRYSEDYFNFYATVKTTGAKFTFYFLRNLSMSPIIEGLLVYHRVEHLQGASVG
jgi:hypothetical protein